MVVVYFIAFYFIRNACNIYVLWDEQLTCYQSLAVCWWCYMARPGWSGLPQNGIEMFTVKFRSDYPGYHPQNKEKCPMCFPGKCITLKKKGGRMLGIWVYGINRQWNGRTTYKLQQRLVGKIKLVMQGHELMWLRNPVDGSYTV
jgi:hypothetical protein